MAILGSKQIIRVDCFNLNLLPGLPNSEYILKKKEYCQLSILLLINTITTSMNINASYIETQ